MLKRLLVTGIVALTVVLSVAGCSGRSDGYSLATGNIWSGVVLHTKDRAPAFRVIGGNDAHRFPDGTIAKGVKVARVGGEEVWQSREMLTQHDIYFVKDDDPALAEKKWKVIAE